MLNALYLVGIVLGPISLVVAFWVIWVYRLSFFKQPRTAADFLVFGILIGFTGKFADNVYWQYTWWAHYSSNPLFTHLFEWGPIVDIFTRQIPLIISGSCHLYAAHLFRCEGHGS